MPGRPAATLSSHQATFPIKKHTQAQLAGIREALCAAFAGRPSNPAFVSALQALAAADRGSWVAPADAAAAAAAAGGVQVRDRAFILGMCECVWGVLSPCRRPLRADAAAAAPTMQPSTSSQ